MYYVRKIDEHKQSHVGECIQEPDAKRIARKGSQSSSDTYIVFQGVKPVAVYLRGRKRKLTVL